MKSTFLAAGIAAAALLLGACNSGNNSGSEQNGGDSSKNATAQTSAKSTSNSGSASPVKALLDPYLQMKNALASDNNDEAAAAGKSLEESFDQFNKTALTGEQRRDFEEIADDARENAEHIGENADKIEHQREHFDMLSKDMYDLVNLLGAGQHLYVDHCPMYNNNKGASWLSEVKEIKNPYLGKKMLTCGIVKEELP